MKPVAEQFVVRVLEYKDSEHILPHVLSATVEFPLKNKVRLLTIFFDRTIQLYLDNIRVYWLRPCCVTHYCLPEP